MMGAGLVVAGLGVLGLLCGPFSRRALSAQYFACLAALFVGLAVALAAIGQDVGRDQEACRIKGGELVSGRCVRVIP